MALPEALAPFFVWELSRWQVYGLFFLLGSFVVASLSDIKHLSAQREFMDVWIAFIALMLLLDLVHVRWHPDLVFTVKWILVIVLSALTHRGIGVILRLATADVIAIAAAAALLSPLLVVAFIVALKLLSIPLGKLLARGKNVYPFLPVVTLASVAILALAALTNRGLFI